MNHVEKLTKKAVQKFTNERVSVHSELESNLGLDSLDTIELLMELEHQLNIQIPDNYLHERLGSDWKKATVQQWIEAVSEKHYQ
mgnify:CR=1 FL=1